MNGGFKSNYHQFLVAMAATVLAASSGWAWHRHPRGRIPRAQPAAASPGRAGYAQTDWPLPDTGPAVWAQPAGQSRGPDWLFEVFTPPVIYYNATARSFTVIPPRLVVEPDVPFGLELIEVKREPYRLQLAGYFGGTEDRLVAFVSPNEPGIRFARPGDRIDALGLTFRSFAVGKVIVGQTAAGPVYEVAGVAVLGDEKSGAEVVLDSRFRRFSDTPVAVFRSREGGGPRELHEGDAFADEICRYRIEHIRLDPAEVAVAWYSPGRSLLESRILHPVVPQSEAGSPPAALTSSPLRPPAAGLAVSGQ